MSRPDRLFVEHRAVVGTTAIDGVFGSTDLVCVKSDATGKLVLADQGEAEGIIWTPEGKSESGLASYKTATAGSKYTVMQVAQIVEAADIAVGLSIWSVDSGAVSTSAPGTGTVQKLGTAYYGDNGEVRLFVNVSL